MKCEYCELIADRSKAEILYEDEEVVVAVKIKVIGRINYSAGNQRKIRAPSRSEN